jgi:hypothetical protein
MGFLRRRFSHSWYARDWEFLSLASPLTPGLITLRLGMPHQKVGELLARLFMFLFMFFSSSSFVFTGLFFCMGGVCLGLELSNDYNDFNDFTT